MSGRTWEYLVVPGTAEVDELNRLGADGWEMTGHDGLAMIFKRPGPLEPESFRESVTLGQKAHYYGVWGIEGREETTS